MKTAEEILQEIIKNSPTGHMVCGQKEIIEAMKQYASQAVEECAVVAEAYTSYGDAYVKTHSILSVKANLK